MQQGQKMKTPMRRVQFIWPAMGVYVAAISALVVIGAGAAIVSSGGFSVETGGMKISLQLSSPDGTKVVFRRAGHSGE